MQRTHRFCSRSTTSPPRKEITLQNLLVDLRQRLQMGHRDLFVDLVGLAVEEAEFGERAVVEVLAFLLEPLQDLHRAGPVDQIIAA